MYRIYSCNYQRHVVLSRFIRAGTEKGVEVFSENVMERIDVDSGVNVEKRYLWGEEKKCDSLKFQQDNG